MEIEVGEYVRTDNGIIGKYVKYRGIEDRIENNYRWIGFDIEKDIVNHSKRIIDLIEKDDFVNGRKVQQVFIDPFTKKKRLLIEGTEVNWQGDMSSIYCEAEDIKTILTHEQFQQNAYRLEGK